MKKLFPLAILLYVLSGFTIKSFYTLSFKNINGQRVATDSFRNKKLLVVILPTDTDSAFLKQVDSVSNQYSNDITIIGVPGAETMANTPASSLKSFYQQFLGPRVIVTEVMRTTKASSQQHALFRWLTNKDENLHFDINAAGPGSKYFINGNGELYGVLGPSVQFTSSLISSTIL
jgi:glutathione peroxidase